MFRAQECKARSVAFPLISSGIFGYPPYEALRIAVTAIEQFLSEQKDSMDVSLCIMDDDLFRRAQEKRDELTWVEIGKARAKWLLEYRRSTERPLAFEAVHFCTDEELEKVRSLPHEEAVLYRKKLINEHIKHSKDT